MIKASSLLPDLSRLKPGGTYLLPDCDIEGNLLLPRALSGSPNKFIRIVGQPNTRILATDYSKAALGGGGCKWLRVIKVHTVGGLNGFQFSQNGDEYDPLKMIEQIYLVDCIAEDPRDDCFKLNGGRQVHLVRCHGIGGRDQIVDFLGIRGGSIRASALHGAICAITCKGGTSDVDIIGNTIYACIDGIHYGERTAERWRAPWTDAPAERLSIVNNTIQVTGNPIALAKGVDGNVAQLLRDNMLMTTKKARGQMAPLVEVY